MVKATGPGAAYLDHAFRSPSNLGPRPTPTIPDGGKWSVYGEVQIPTPPQHPYDAIRDIHEWPAWNRFNPDVLVTKHPSPHARRLRMEQGAFMTFTVQLTPDERTTSKEACQHLEPLKHRGDGRDSHAAGGNVTRIRWTSDNANLLLPGFVLRTERVTEIEESKDGEQCRVRTWITFTGVKARGYKKKYGEALKARIQDFCEDLRERAVKLYKEEQAGGGQPMA